MAFRTFSEPILLEPARAGASIRYYQAQEDIKQGQMVTSDTASATDQQAIPSNTDGERLLGIALYDASANDMVAVAESGVIVRATAGQSINAGEPVASHGNSGEEGEVATAASGDFIVGRAKKDAVGTNSTVEIVLEPEGFTYGGSVT
jgi:hypothetical protein